MGKKKSQAQQPPKPQEFHSTPFSSLKGVHVSAALPPKITIKVPVISPVTIEDDGSDLFLQAMGGVRKLETPSGNRIADDRDRSRAGRPVSQKSKGAAPLPIDPVSSDLFLEEISRLKLEVKFTAQLPEEDELKPLSGNRLKQLKRGIVTVERQLDLHGLTRDEALAELPRFLRNACQKGATAVLVITGKGLNSPSEPVLQRAVAGWLRDAGRDLVIEYAPAPREMGGGGAFVVFLRSLPKPATVPA